MIKAVILAGGSGTRLWPLSRATHPKQFLNLQGDYTMLQTTLMRLNDLEISSSITICNEEHRFFVAEQLREINKLDKIILEPFGKNTAPAIALAALASDDDPLLLVLPADQLIQDEAAFQESVKNAIPLAESGKLVTFGVFPSKAHTGFGYIKKGNQTDKGYEIENFIEKPPIEVAQKLVDGQNYLWNCGIFLFKASRYLSELKLLRPDIYNSCKAAMDESNPDIDFLRINSEKFNTCPAESIDNAIMENTSDGVVIEMEVGWSDIGSWSSLWDISKKDKNGNAGFGDIILKDSKNTYINATDKLVTAIGIEDLVIVDSKDALLVAHKDSVQNTKIIVRELQTKNRSEWKTHREVHRPWGKYDLLSSEKTYQVKLLTVKAGGKLSLQKHQYRSEHWVVVSGTAKIINGKDTLTLSENESTFISTGAIHSLENPGKDKLEIIEVQSGTYLGEDDIVRIEDIYGRE